MIVSDEGFVDHVDHRECGAAAIDAAVPAAANAMAFPGHVRSDGLAPHAVERLYLFWSERPNLSVDVSTEADRRARALGAHASQAPRTIAGRTERFALIELR